VSPYERQVADALHVALMRAGWKNYPTAAIAMDLAPHVAAAIDVALRADGAHPGSYDAALRELGDAAGAAPEREEP
jgi:hypothetical protein